MLRIVSRNVLLLEPNLGKLPDGPGSLRGCVLRSFQ